MIVVISRNFLKMLSIEIIKISTKIFGSRSLEHIFTGINSSKTSHTYSLIPDGLPLSFFNKMFSHYMVLDNTLYLVDTPALHDIWVIQPDKLIKYPWQKCCAFCLWVLRWLILWVRIPSYSLIYLLLILYWYL